MSAQQKKNPFDFKTQYELGFNPQDDEIVIDYIISHGVDGKPFTKTQQVHMCGNSVSPPPMAVLARANDPWRTAVRRAEAA
jgi:hypothetical protein